MTQNDSITFGDLGVSTDLLKVLKTKNLINPTPIQSKCISIGLEGKDIIGIAQTGTGKTLAFGLPVIEKIRSEKAKCLILLPTRELAIQVNEVLSNLGKTYNIKTALLIGGSSIQPQKIALNKKPEIIIATPGRIIDHLHQRTCNLNHFNIVVLDEADRMLDIGFMPQIREILKSVPNQRQTMLFSATMPQEIADLTNQYMNKPIRIEVAPAGSSAENVIQEAAVLSFQEKLDFLKNIARKNSGTIIVFTRTKFRAKRITVSLKAAGFEVTEMHSNRSLAQRKNSLEGFKSGKYQILVATDVAARGLDVKNIFLVINYDLPENPEDYVHRIGRTGRAGKSGRALAFVDPTENRKLRDIEKLIKKEIKIIWGQDNLYGYNKQKDTPFPRRKNSSVRSFRYSSRRRRR